MRMSLLLLFLFISGICSAADAAAKSCVGPQNSPYDNYCSGEYDEETGHKTPNCVNVGTQATPDWRCARCAVNCDCPPGDYCVKTPGPSAGTCVSLASTSKIGAVCTSFSLPGTPGARTPIKGVDEVSMCGAAIFDSATERFLQYEWLGNCVGGKCKECAGSNIAWAVAVSAQMVPGMSDAATSNGSAWDAGRLVCDDRMCSRGYIVAETPWYLDMLPTGVVTGILVFVILIFLVIVIAATVECCSRHRDGRIPSMLQRAAGLPIRQRNGHARLEEDANFVIGMDEEGGEEKGDEKRRTAEDGKSNKST